MRLSEPVDPSECHCGVGDVAETASTAECCLSAAETSAERRREEGRAEEPKHEGHEHSSRCPSGHSCSAKGENFVHDRYPHGSRGRLAEAHDSKDNRPNDSPGGAEEKVAGTAAVIG